MKKESDHWCEWTCPFCLAEMSDPISIKETTCSNGHTVYLGKATETRYGWSRRAFKTRSERISEQRKEKSMHESAMLIFQAFKKK